MTPADGLARVAFLSFGFRPFFLGGALWAALAMLLWIALMAGHLDFAATYGAAAWHAHELLFGYVAAIVAGFLLTAVPNWTGRLPVRGGGLLALFALWVVGRAAMLASSAIGVVPAAVLDSLFLLALLAVIMREIAAARDRRNAKVGILVMLLAVANMLFHVEVLTAGAADYGTRLGAAVVVGLVMLIGGRITPSFTRNWLAKQASERLPESFGRFDQVTLAIAAFALLMWIAWPQHPATAAALVIAGLGQAMRLARWAGASTWREPLVLVLHVGYAFIPLGFLLIGLSVLWPAAMSGSDALHAWTAGTVGVMTLAVMTRASLGHTGRALTASAGTQAIYAAVSLSALLRIAAPLLPGLYLAGLTLAGAAWTAGFAGFVLLYGPMLLRPRAAAT